MDVGHRAEIIGGAKASIGTGMRPSMLTLPLLSQADLSLTVLSGIFPNSDTATPQFPLQVCFSQIRRASELPDIDGPGAVPSFHI